MIEATIRAATEKDADAIAVLVESVFIRFVAPSFEEEGERRFRAFAAPDALRSRLRDGNKVWIAEADGRIVGVLERDDRHIRLLFVDAAWQRRGIGRRLLTAALERLGSGPVTVNAARDAVDAYSRLGFRPKGPVTAHEGVVFVPMTLDHKAALVG